MPRMRQSVLNEVWRALEESSRDWLCCGYSVCGLPAMAILCLLVSAHSSHYFSLSTRRSSSTSLFPYRTLNHGSLHVQRKYWPLRFPFAWTNVRRLCRSCESTHTSLLFFDSFQACIFCYTACDPGKWWTKLCWFRCGLYGKISQVLLLFSFRWHKASLKDSQWALLLCARMLLRCEWRGIWTGFGQKYGRRSGRQSWKKCGKLLHDQSLLLSTWMQVSWCLLLGCQSLLVCQARRSPPLWQGYCSRSRLCNLLHSIDAWGRSIENSAWIAFDVPLGIWLVGFDKYMECISLCFR